MESKLFRKYTGTKTVEALPATAIEAKQKFNANIPNRVVDANPGKEGYVIDYPEGYRSWCPKKEFEDCYKVSETHIDRMKIELAELTDRICKATKAFLNLSLSRHDRWMLGKQLEPMREYAKILADRIDEAETPDSDSNICEVGIQKTRG